jgi:hypothetical protein
MTKTWRGMKTRPNMNPYPLESIVLQAFTKREAHDVFSLSLFLTGGAVVQPGHKAYRTVAKDVLGYMTCQGKLELDKYGWYRLTAFPPVRNSGKISP